MKQQMTGRAVSLPLRDYSMPQPPSELLHDVNEAGTRWLRGRKLAVKDSTYIKI